MTEKKIALVMGALFAGMSVALGAFAAHGLRAHLSLYELSIFKTGSDYQMFHGLALLAVGASGVCSRWTVGLFVLGIVIFSGSLYLLAVLHQSWFGMVTPIGGALLLLGWSFFAKQLFHLKK